MILLNDIDIDITLYSGCDLIIEVFKMIFGNIGIFLSTFFMLTFALATIVSQYYLGETNLLFIMENTKIKNKKIMKLLFQMIFLFGIFIGVFFNIERIWSFVDVGMVLLGVVNIYALIKLNKIFDENLIKYNIDKKR